MSSYPCVPRQFLVLFTLFILLYLHLYHFTIWSFPFSINNYYQFLLMKRFHHKNQSSVTRFCKKNETSRVFYWELLLILFFVFWFKVKVTLYPLFSVWFHESFLLLTFFVHLMTRLRGSSESSTRRILRHHLYEFGFYLPSRLSDSESGRKRELDALQPFINIHLTRRPRRVKVKILVFLSSFDPQIY